MGHCLEKFPQVAKHPFSIIAFDWEGTAVPDRQSGASEVASAIGDLLRLEVLIVVITGTSFDKVDRQLSPWIDGPSKQNLFVCADCGSEVYGFDADSSQRLLYRREASSHEETLLDRVAEAVKHDIEGRSSVNVDVIYDRLNRRKIDLIPEWKDPPRAQAGQLLEAAQQRLRDGGFQGGIHSAFALADHYARDFGLEDARVASDVKHIEIGLTDKSDSVLWVTGELARRKNIAYGDILIAGDEFGPVAGFEGSDFRMVLPELAGITYVSVGTESGGVPEGVDLLGGGPECFAQLLESQRELQRERLPSEQATDVIVESGFNPLREREVESLLTVGNGYLGTRGSLEEQVEASDASTLVNGVYDKVGQDTFEELVVAPDWTYTRIFADDEQLVTQRRDILHNARTLDMKKGVLFREWRHLGPHNRITRVRYLRLASLADRHAVLERIQVMPENYRGELRVETGLRICAECRPQLSILVNEPVDGHGSDTLVSRTNFTGIKLVQAQKSRFVPAFIEPQQSHIVDRLDLLDKWAWLGDEGQQLTIEKFVSTFTSRDDDNPELAARAHVRRLEGRGFNRLMRDHLKAWRERWRIAAVTVGDDPQAQHALNFAGYHLISAGNPLDGRVSVSARSLTGSIYKGHIFWDAEMFILPFFVYTDPVTARAMLMYRFHTLVAARRNARAHGYSGALFAWESTLNGDDMTPRAVINPVGEIVPVLSGKLEHHIDADVAHATWNYWNATRDDHFLVRAGAELMVETARLWASCAEQKGGAYHINNVEGPDEYHEEGVDDNFYTNAMAAWNLRHSAHVVDYLKQKHPVELARLQDRIGLHMDEPAEWRRIASQLYRGMQRGNVIEQFAGYFGLEDIDISRLQPSTAPIGTILGRDRVIHSQIVKQADVVMALYLLEDEIDQETIRKSFEYYEKRTTHGSSLSPAIYGLVAARLGLMDRALGYFRRAGGIDISDGNAAGGIHVAALGGLWQLVVFGFAGIRMGEEGIRMNPQLPEDWDSLAFKFLWRGHELSFDIGKEQQLRLEVRGRGQVQAGILGGELQTLRGGEAYMSRWQNGAWQQFEPAGEPARAREVNS